MSYTNTNNLTPSVQCKYLLPCGLCDKTGQNCTELYKSSCGLTFYSPNDMNLTTAHNDVNDLDVIKDLLKNASETPAVQATSRAKEVEKDE